MVKISCDFVKINTNVGLNNNDRIIGRCMVVKDENSKLIFIVASLKSEVCSPLCAKLQALL